MMQWLILFFLFVNIGANLLTSTPIAHAAYPEDFSKPLTRIAFGSCNKTTRPQPIWASILDAEPDLWIWTGDIVYADSAFKPDKIRFEYTAQKQRPEYQEFFQRIPIIGIWDDHDYGINDIGKNNPIKYESQAALLDFLDEPAKSPRRQRDGIYTAYEFGPPGKRTKIILLDDRFFRDDPGERRSVLGKRQWKWFKRELLRSQADVNILVSSTVIIPEDYGPESWTQYPYARARLFKLLRRAYLKKIVLVSGDLHIGDMSRIEGFYPDGSDLYEISSSGLTHFNKGTWHNQKNRYSAGPPPFFNLNFGLISIDWGNSSTDPITATFEIRDVDNQVRLQAKQVFPR